MKTTFLAALSLLAVLSNVWAADIGWTATSLSGAGNVSTNGTGLEALNFSGGTNSVDYDTTINGVLFSGLVNGLNGNNNFANPSAIYFSSDSEKVTPTQNNNYDVPPGLAEYDDLLSRWLFGGVSGASGNNITLTGLDPGSAYEVQLFIAGSDTSYIVVDDGTAGAFGGSGTTTIGDTGMVLTGIFTADVSSQSFSLTKYNSDGTLPNNPMHLNGYQLRLISEVPIVWPELYPYLNEVDGKLVYGAMNLQGDQLIDFSQVGYRGGEPIPDVDDIPVVKVIGPTGSNDTAIIQAAIDEVAELPVQPNGYRGAILMRDGTYDIRQSVKIKDSGIVLRGAGVGKTIWTSAPDAGTVYDNLFLQVGNSAKAPVQEQIGTSFGNNPCGYRKIVYDHTVGAVAVPVVGDWIMVQMLMNVDGQTAIGIVSPSGTKNRGEVRMQVTGVTPLGGSVYELETDIPLVFGLRPDLGGAKVFKLTPDIDVPRDIGVRDFTMQPQFLVDTNNLIDRDCKGIAVTADYCEDVWFENLVMLNFFENGIKPLDECFQATLSHCHVQAMTVSSSELSDGGYFAGGAYGFRGERLLYNALSAAALRHGPLGNQTAAYNVMLDLMIPDYGCEPGHADMVPGILFDRAGRANPQGRINAVFFGEPGHGWGTQNSLFWNYVLDEMNVESPRSNGAERVHFDDTYVTFPPDASEDPFVFRNMSFGGFQGNESDNRYDARDYIAYETFVGIDSIYVRQLIDRLGETEVRKRLPAWQVDGYGPAPTVSVSGNDMTFSVYNISKTAYGFSNGEYTIYWTDDVHRPYAEWTPYTGPVPIEKGRVYYARVVCTAGYSQNLESPILQYDPAFDYFSVYFKEFYDKLKTIQEGIQAHFEPTLFVGADADAQVRSGIYGDDNYGNETSMQCTTTANLDNTREDYLRFDVSALGSKPISRVLLRLKVESENGVQDAHTAYFVDDDTWLELGITWNNKPATGVWLAQAPQLPTGEWVEFDVTDQVVNEYFTDGIFSVVLVSDGNRLAKYYSREADSENRPQLAVSFVGESSPRFKIVSNGNEDTDATDASAGVISFSNSVGGGTPAVGFTAVDGICATGADSITAEWVVSGTSSNVNPTANGWFFGMQDRTARSTAEATSGNLLWNNDVISAGIVVTAGDGLQLGRSDGSSKSTTTLLPSGTLLKSSYEDGFTVSFTLNSNSTWSAWTSGLSTDISTNGVLDPLYFDAISRDVYGSTFYQCGSSNQTSVYCDSLRVMVDKEVVYPEEFSLHMDGMGAMVVSGTNLSPSATYILQGRESLGYGHWENIFSTSGVSVLELDDVVVPTNEASFYRALYRY